jgi:peptide-N4-(N-acetyl-beta-glucosaminyl)asparagine amidase
VGIIKVVAVVLCPATSLCWISLLTRCCRVLCLLLSLNRIWSRKEQRWLHADSCENVLDEPLLYERGWGKKLNYVVAVGVGSVADVTRRYTEKYDEVLTRRTLADEGWLASEIARLNDVAVGAVPAHERAMYIERNERDRARLMGEMPADGSTESLPGRQSGSAAWVRARGEDGEK